MRRCEVGVGGREREKRKIGRGAGNGVEGGRRTGCYAARNGNWTLQLRRGEVDMPVECVTVGRGDVVLERDCKERVYT